MAFTNAITGTRTSSIQTVPFEFTLSDLPTVGNDSTDSFYLPVVAKNTTATAFTLTGQTLVSGGAVFTPNAEDFAKIRVGDVVSAVSAGTVNIPSPSTYTRTAHIYHSLNFIVLTGTSSLPKDGDGISGTGIASGAKVTRVDTATRTVYLDLANTESSVLASPVTITITPLVRVTGLNTTTRVVTLSANFAGTGTDVAGSITFTPNPFDPVIYFIEGRHTRSGNILTGNYNVYRQTGLAAFDALGTGTDATDLSTVTATTLGSFTIDTDSYFLNARVARSAS